MVSITILSGVDWSGSVRYIILSGADCLVWFPLQYGLAQTGLVWYPLRYIV